jgi:dihydrofolate reductase
VAEFAGIWREMPKFVFSRTLQRASWNTTIVRDVDVDEITSLQQRSAGDLFVGGADLAATFMAHDLIDEYRLYVHPVVIGSGRRLFPASYVAALRLIETRSFGNGVVLLHYERA